MNDIASLLKSFAEDIKKDVSKRLQDNADLSLRNHEETRREIGGLKGELHEVRSTVNILWRKVNGPHVPPPKTSGEYRQVDANVQSKKPLVEHISDHDLDLSSLKGQVRGLDMKVDGLDTKVDGLDTKVDNLPVVIHEKMTEIKEVANEVKKVAENVLVINQKQSESMGVGVSLKRIGDFLNWTRTKEGQRYVATLVAAIGSLATAGGTFYALLTKRLPMPTDPIPTSTVYVPVPAPPPVVYDLNDGGQKAKHP